MKDVGGDFKTGPSIDTISMVEMKPTSPKIPARNPNLLLTKLINPVIIIKGHVIRVKPAKTTMR